MIDPRQQAIFAHYGMDHQLEKFSEEARELVEAIEAYRATKKPQDFLHLLEEFADVLNVGDQIASCTGPWAVINEIREKKIERQLKRIEREKACKENDGPL